MSIGRERKVETRFARKAATGRGVGIDEAVASAEARIETLRGDACARIGETVQEMQAAARAGGPALDTIHGKADSLVGLCGIFGLPEISQTASSLCQLFDLCAPARPRADAVDVHLTALQLFWSSPPPARAAMAPTVLEGLREVVATARQSA